MAGLEAVLRISATDDTAKALAAIKERIAGIEKSAGQLDKTITSMGNVTRATDPLAKSLLGAQKALAAQRSEISGVIDGLDRLTGPTDRAAAAQRQLAREVTVATDALARQGETAARTPGRAGAGGGRGPAPPSSRIASDVLPLAGPGILAATTRAVTAGASVEEEIARLKAAGATPAEIDKARAQFRDMSRRYSGMTETDYLAAFKDARVIAPGESQEMAGMGARYRLALRNSGISSSDYDVGNVMRIMDEVGLNSTGDREHFLDYFLKAQQAFGGQISTETALAAYRNAKQSIYDWSPEFREKYFPTLLQSAGQQGGTEMMTALNNYVGHHMSKTEIESLEKAGFVRPQDVVTDHGRTTFRDNAQLFESDLFKSNIAKWAWDFHDSFMKRPGSTDSTFDDLIAKMPRNMAGLIAFLVHGENRFKRDANTVTLPVGMKAAGDDFLANNPVAGLEALKNAITQFSAAVAEPAMGKIGAGLQEMAHGIQAFAAGYGDFAKAHPAAAKDAGIFAGLGLGAAGTWLTSKLLGYFGFGSSAGGGALAGAGGPLTALGLSSYELGDPNSALNVWMRNNLNKHPGVSASDDWKTTGDWRTRAAYARQADDHPMLYGVRDMEGARARALSHLTEGGHVSAPPQDVHVSGDAKIATVVTVVPGSALLDVVDRVKTIEAQIALNPVATGHAGRMDSDAAPLRGGIGHQ